ncbi:MAG: Ig-like domain-containing protein [Thermoanaerobaculia bacterium]
MRTFGRIALGLALGLTVSVSAVAQSASWVFDSVAPVVPPPGCEVYANITGLGFDAIDRGVAGWQANWGCGGTGIMAWARKDGGVWVANQIVDPSSTPGLQPRGLPADLEVGPDGTPYYAFASVGSAYIFGNFGWFQVTVADLDANPTGSTDRRRLIQQYQDCTSAYPNFAMAFTAGNTRPNVLTGTRCMYGGWLALDAEGESIGALHGAPIFTTAAGTGGEFISTDYATGPAGGHHIVYYYERGGPTGWGVGYNNGTPGHELQLAVPHRNRGAEVSIVTDATGRIHVAIGGIPTCNNAFEGGLLYATSSDGVSWDKTFVDVVSGRLPSIAIDGSGNPTISYYRYGDEIRLARKTSDGWTSEVVTRQSTAVATPSTRLAFDGEQQPNVLFYDKAASEIVLATGPAAPPFLTLPSPGDQTGATGRTVSLVLAATGGDGGLSYQATCLPAGLSIDPATGTITGTLPADAGESRATVTVTDEAGTTAAVSFVWTFASPPPNTAPAAVSRNVSTPEDTPVDLTLLADDADGDSLTYALVSAPAHGTIAIAGDLATYTPEANYHGPDAFSFRANDGTADSNEAVVYITVEAVNDAPTLAAVADQTVTAGTPISFALSATDIDGDALAFGASPLPAGASLDPQTGAFSWTPSAAQAGSYTIPFHVTDPGGLSASREATITVLRPLPVVDCTGARPNVAEIWPPNHQTVAIEILGVTNATGVSVISVLQDEPTDTFGDGTTSVDGGGTGSPRAWVRAERSGTKKVPGNGRVYEIRFTAQDAGGGTCDGSVFVGVPHDKGRGPAIDDGIRYDSTVAGGPPLP